MHNTETTLFTNVIVFAFQICNERNNLESSVPRTNVR